MKCHIAAGLSCRDCGCRLPEDGGWLPCPPKTEGLRRLASTVHTPSLSGDPCPSCGNFSLVWSGTCQTCQTCGTTTGCS